MNKELLAEAIKSKRQEQSKLIVLPTDCCTEDAARLEEEAQRKYPLHEILAVLPVTAKSYPLRRVCEAHETYSLCGERASC